MANIMILGDTWGTVPCHALGYMPGVLEWFEYQFLRRGHPTFNKSWGGNQNNYQLLQAEVFFKAMKNSPMHVDLIVWFHTEIVRDLIPDDTRRFGIDDFDLVIDDTAERIYDWATNIKKLSPDTKWAIIGGHAPLRPNKKHLLDWADFRIDNFRSHILGVDVPESQAFEFLERGKGSLWDWPAIPQDIIDRELAIKEQIIQLTSDTTKFWNGKHAGIEPMKQLANDIITKFNL
jgi:Rad3-related DNA helicase